MRSLVFVFVILTGFQHQTFGANDTLHFGFETGGMLTYASILMGYHFSDSQEDIGKKVGLGLALYKRMNYNDYRGLHLNFSYYNLYLEEWASAEERTSMLLTIEPILEYGAKSQKAKQVRFEPVVAFYMPLSISYAKAYREFYDWHWDYYDESISQFRVGLGLGAAPGFKFTVKDNFTLRTGTRFHFEWHPMQTIVPVHDMIRWNVGRHLSLVAVLQLTFTLKMF